MENIIREIKGFISKKSRIPVNELADSTEIINSGVLSSMTVIEMVVHLEKIFKVEIGGEELSPKNFKDIQTLAAFIQSKSSSLRTA